MKTLFALLGLALVMASPAAGHPEANAPQLHPLVVAARHEPEVVEPGTQWRGFLRLKEGHNIAFASYQVCNVGDGFCFAPLTAAHLSDATTFSFDTNQYLANGKPVEWKAGWVVGIHWRLDDGMGNVSWVPRPPPAEGEIVPLQDLYLTFELAAAPSQGIASTPWHLLVLALLVTTIARRS